MMRDDYPPRLCRATRVQKECKGDRQVTGDSRSNPLRAAFVIALVMLLLMFLFWPTKTKEAPALTNTQITEFRKLYQEVQRLDRTIAKLDRELIFVETGGDLAKSKVSVENYYQQLSKLYELRMDRTRYAQDYNGLVRIHFSQSKTSPLELYTVKLPVGIR